MRQVNQSEKSFVSRVVREDGAIPRVGIVTKVFEHTSDTDNSNIEVNLRSRGREQTWTKVPVLEPFDGADIPSKGDAVLILLLDSRQPVVARKLYTEKERPPLTKAGMFRRVYDSGTSPAGDGNLHVTSYTSYDGDPAADDPDTLTAQETWIQMAKHAPEAGMPSSPRMAMEMYDSPLNDAAHIRLQGAQVDGDTGKGLDIKLDLKDGTVVVSGSNSGDSYQLELDVKNETAKVTGDGSQEMGISLDFVNDSFKVLDGSGYGIVSDGSGNFTWYYNDITYDQGSTTSL